MIRLLGYLVIGLLSYMVIGGLGCKSIQIFKLLYNILITYSPIPYSFNVFPPNVPLMRRNRYNCNVELNYINHKITTNGSI